MKKKITDLKSIDFKVFVFNFKDTHKYLIFRPKKTPQA